MKRRRFLDGFLALSATLGASEPSPDKGRPEKAPSDEGAVERLRETGGEKERA